MTRRQLPKRNRCPTMNHNPIQKSLQDLKDAVNAAITKANACLTVSSGILAACNPNICRRCNTPVHKYRIISNIYDQKTGKCWHVPIFCAWGHRCPDGVKGQLRNSRLINIRTGEDLLHPKKKSRLS